MNGGLKITRIGNSAGVVLPNDVLAHLDAAIGQTLTVTKTPHGIELRAPSTDHSVGGDQRRWSEEQKLRILERASASGISVRLVAREYQVAPSQIYEWRKKFLEAAALAGGGGFAAVVVSPDDSAGSWLPHGSAMQKPESHEQGAH